jgi:hypothetical protein
MIIPCQCRDGLVCLVGLCKHGLKIGPRFVNLGQGGPPLARILRGARTENMVEHHANHLVHSIRGVPRIGLVEPILNLGEQVDYWGRWVPLLLHHLFIFIKLEGGDVALGIK